MKISFDLKRSAPHGRISRRSAVFGFHVAVVSALAGGGFVYSPSSIDVATLVYPSCVLLVLTFVWILWSWFSLRGTLFEPYPIFMIVAGLFNGGQALLEVFGLNADGIMSGRFSPEIIVESLYLVTISSACLHCGALLAIGGKQGHNNGPDQAGPSTLYAVRRAGWILVVVSFVPTIILFRQHFSQVMHGGYFAMYEGAEPVAPLIQVVSAFFIPGVIFLLVGSRRERTTRTLCLLTVAIYAGVGLFLGGRAVPAMVCAAAAWTWDQNIRRIPRKVIVAFALVGLMLCALVGRTRDTRGEDRSVAQTYEALTRLGNPILATISEMGGTMDTIAYTLRLVPASRDFDYGVSYGYALLTVVPNVAWPVHPSIAHGTLSDWLVNTVDHRAAAAGGGLGFSFIAEAYLNFGWVGAPLWLGVLGYALTRVFLLADSRQPAKVALVGSFLSLFIIFVRGESDMVVRALLWYALIPYLYSTVPPIRRARHVATAASFHTPVGNVPAS
jgi:hypothetical protein